MNVSIRLSDPLDLSYRILSDLRANNFYSKVPSPISSHKNGFILSPC